MQELREHRRRPTKTGIVSMLSGLLYCADCGEKLYYSTTNNYRHELVHEFIEKIVVYTPKQVDGKRVQLPDIYFNGVGIVQPMTPEEMEEVFQKRLKSKTV